MKKIILALIPLSYLVILLFQKDLALFTDLGRHLKLGEIIVNCLCVPQTNFFSYTHPDFPIVNHEWLTEVIFYLTSAWFGLNGLLILKFILIITSASLLYSIAVKKGSLFWVTIFSLLCITVFSTRFSVLPELFSYLFISLFIFLIERYKETKNIKYLWILPLIQLFWINMHIYFVIGIGIFGLFLIEEYIQHKKVNKKHLLVGFALVVALLINPSFIKGAFLPFTVFNNYGFTVEENNSPFSVFSQTSTNTNIAYTLTLQVLVFELLAALFIFSLFIRTKWKELFHFGNHLFGFLIAAKFMRCISLLGLLGFIPLVQTFSEWEKRNKDSVEETTANMIKGIIVIFVGIIVFIHIKGLIEYNILSFSFENPSAKATTFIKDNDVKGPIFNNYRIGNYLIYSLYPEKVFVDARPEAYPATFFNEYWRMMEDEQFFNQQVEKYNINTVVFNVDDDPVKIRPFLSRLIYHKDWVPVYGDGQVTIVVRNNEVNKPVIDKFKIVLPDKQPN